MALRSILLARSACFSTAVARCDAPDNSHSIAIEPEPDPKSHRYSPAFGASALNVKALIGDFVICPSWSNQSSDRPAVRGITRPSPSINNATITGCDRLASVKFCAWPEMVFCALSPNDSRQVTCVSPKPVSTR